MGKSYFPQADAPFDEQLANDRRAAAGACYHRARHRADSDIAGLCADIADTADAGGFLAAAARNHPFRDESGQRARERQAEIYRGRAHNFPAHQPQLERGEIEENEQVRGKSAGIHRLQRVALCRGRHEQPVSTHSRDRYAAGHRIPRAMVRQEDALGTAGQGGKSYNLAVNKEAHDFNRGYWFETTPDLSRVLSQYSLRFPRSLR